MRALYTAMLAILVLVAGGCGGQNVGLGGPSAAEQLKPGALVYWETVSDPGSDQWEQAGELLRRFPDGEKWIADLRRSFERETEATWPEVEAALGDRIAVVVYATSMSDAHVVGLTNSADPDKAVALVQKLNEANADESDAVVRVVDDWVVIAEKTADIDAALKAEGGQSLADDEDFKSGMAELPEDALSRVYVDVAAALDQLGGANEELDRSLRMLGLGELDFAGAWVKARDDGAEVAGVLRGEGADKLLGATEPYSSKLLDLVPADAFAFASIQGEGVTAQLEALRDNPLFRRAFREVEDELGVSIQELVGLFDGEVAFYGAPGLPIPELTLLLDSKDPARARQSADRLLRGLAAREGGEVTEDGDVTTAVLDDLTLNLATVESTLVLTTTKNAIENLGSGDKLADSDRFEDALDAAGAPEEYTGLLYVDLAEAVSLIMGYASVTGESVPPEIARNLEPLRSVVAFGEQDGALGRSQVFLEIE